VNLLEPSSDFTASYYDVNKAKWETHVWQWVQGELVSRCCASLRLVYAEVFQNSTLVVDIIFSYMQNPDRKTCREEITSKT
jgi:hypothetical protein